MKLSCSANLIIKGLLLLHLCDCSKIILLKHLAVGLSAAFKSLIKIKV